MIRHDQGAVAMAKAGFANGENTAAIAMTDNIVTTQQAGVDQMTKMLGR
jgi:uncharacterized protein (DUF305 family)